MDVLDRAATGKERRDAVTSILDRLRRDLTEQTLKTSERDQLLEQLKVYGRRPDDAAAIFTKDGISTLAQYATDSKATSTAREALRCLANTLLLRQETRQVLVDCGAAPKLASKLTAESTDDEFLLSRILFLFTYGTDVDFGKLIKKNHLADSLNLCLARHSKRYGKTLTRRLTSTGPTPMDDMALNETCKLIFNITHFFPELQTHFTKAIPDLVTILRKSKLTNPPLEPPLAAVVNALMNLDLFAGRDALFPKLDPKGTVEQLVNILDAAVSHYKAAELDLQAAPVLTLMRKIYGIGTETAKKHMKSLLLPSDAERSKPLGKSDSLPSRLLRLSSSAATPTLRTSISALLFELSDSNPDTFVQNVGYGFAAGFLMSQNLPVPPSANEDTTAGARINPITGQRLEFEEQMDEGPPMTEEEKEQEAERLFVLFERLRNTGVVDVKNPVREAVESGRFEELPDDYKEDDKKENCP